MLNVKNLIENIIYITLIGVVMIVSTYVTIGQFEGMVKAAIQQETTQIENNIKTEIKKLKAFEGSNINLSTTPEIENTATTIISKDSIPEKKTFFKRIFGKKDN